MSPERYLTNFTMDILPPDILKHFFNGSLNMSLEELMKEPNTSAVVSRHSIWPCFFWITFVIGMFGNWLVVYILFRKKNLRTVTNLYLLNLAVVDILYLMATLPNTSYWDNYWPWGDFMCKLIHYMMSVTLTVSVMSLTAVGLDRHYAILYPVTSRRHRTLGKTVVVIAIFWIASFIIGSPAFLIARTIDVYDSEVCLNFWREQWQHQAKSVVMFILFYIIPQTILAFCYFRIGQRLWFSMRLHDKPNTTAERTLRTRRRVVKMVMVITVCFAICWFPVHVVELYTAYGTAFNSAFTDIKLLAPLVPHFFIATNPIIYCFMSKTFRNNFKAAFPCYKALTPAISLDDRDSAMHRRCSNKRTIGLKPESECSCEKSNHELTEIVSVDKAVNTSPKINTLKHSEDANSSNDGALISNV